MLTSFFKNVKYRLKIIGYRRGKSHYLFGFRVSQHKFVRMQQLTVQLKLVTAAVYRVADDGMMHKFCVHSYLVGAPRFQLELAKSIS